MAAMPVALPANLFATVDDIDKKPLEQQPDDGLTLLLGRGRHSPKNR
jgi:hypothetical protein